MDTLSSTQFVLLLHSVPHLGEKALARLLRLNAQGRIRPDACLRLSAAEWKRTYELHPQAAAHLEEQREALFAASAELARTLRAHDIALLTVESATYPARLDRNADVPPPVMYALGSLALLQAASPSPSVRFTFTIAVSNGADSAVLARQDEIATALVQAGGVPVTGHDRGPYQRLALAAQRHNRPVCYVLDRGLREALGPELDRPLFAAARIRDTVFEPSRDLVLSCFRMDDHGLAANNRRRDGLIFALSDLIVALDVRAEGNMIAACLRAQAQARPVWTVDGGRDGYQTLRDAGCPVLPNSPDWPTILTKMLS